MLVYRVSKKSLKAQIGGFLNGGLVFSPLKHFKNAKSPVSSAFSSGLSSKFTRNFDLSKKNFGVQKNVLMGGSKRFYRYSLWKRFFEQLEVVHVSFNVSRVVLNILFHTKNWKSSWDLIIRF